MDIHQILDPDRQSLRICGTPDIVVAYDTIGLR